MSYVRVWHMPWLVLLRLYAGVFWLAHGVPKFLNSARYMPPDGFMPQTVAKAAANSSGAYHDFLVNVVTPNIGVFAELARLGEVLAGLSLLLGVLTPVGGIVGCLLALNYWLALGDYRSFMTAVSSLEAAAFALSFLSIPLGRAVGVDALFVRREPKERPIIPEFVDEPPPG